VSQKNRTTKNDESNDDRLRRGNAGFRLLTAEEVADILSVTVQWVRDHTTRAKPIIPHIPMGRRTTRYRLADVEEFVRSLTETRPTWDR